MTSPTQTLPEAPSGAATPVEYSPAQLAEMQAIPSRQYLENGTKNPFYNAKMDPGSDRWTAYEYFKRQPQVEVWIHPDPEMPGLEVGTMSINGFALRFYPNKRNRMPSDFVDLLRQRNHRFDVIEMGLVSSHDGEGSLKLSVNSSPDLKPFVRRVAD